MNINFNNVRKQALYSFEDLVKKLNSAIVIRKDQSAIIPGSYHGQRRMNIEGYVLVDAQEIQECMDDLRNQIGAIAMTYQEGDEKFKDVFSEVYKGEDESMPVFNEEKETA